MIDLSASSFRKVPSRFLSVVAMSPQQARVEAQKILQEGLKPNMARVIDLLSVAGVLPEARFGVSGRTLRSYRAKRILDRLPFTTQEVSEVLEAYGMPVVVGSGRSMILYTLGPVGIEISKERHGVSPPTGYLSYPLERTSHDLVMNEIVLQIAGQAMENGWRTVWVSKYEATLYNEDGAAILEPDAMLRLTKDGDELVYLFEFHNEDKSTRAHSKVRKYETAASLENLWAQAWEVEEFPPLVAVFRKPIVGTGYNEAVREVSPHVQIYGRTLTGALKDDFSVWYHFNVGKKEKLFPWHLED